MAQHSAVVETTFLGPPWVELSLDWEMTPPPPPPPPLSLSLSLVHSYVKVSLLGLTLFFLFIFADIKCCAIFFCIFFDQFPRYASFLSSPCTPLPITDSFLCLSFSHMITITHNYFSSFIGLKRLTCWLSAWSFCGGSISHFHHMRKMVLWPVIFFVLTVVVAGVCSQQCCCLLLCVYSDPYGHVPDFSFSFFSFLNWRKFIPQTSCKHPTSYQIMWVGGNLKKKKHVWKHVHVHVTLDRWRRLSRFWPVWVNCLSQSPALHVAQGRGCRGQLRGSHVSRSSSALASLGKYFFPTVSSNALVFSAIFSQLFCSLWQNAGRFLPRIFCRRTQL